jgi:hypothetical protein
MTLHFRETKTTANRIAGMAQTRSPQEIADILGIEEDEVCAFLEKAGKPAKTAGVLICMKTSREWKVRSERGAYRQAMLQGLTDWDYLKA